MSEVPLDESLIASAGDGGNSENRGNSPAEIVKSPEAQSVEQLKRNVYALKDLTALLELLKKGETPVEELLDHVFLEHPEN